MRQLTLWPGLACHDVTDYVWRHIAGLREFAGSPLRSVFPLLAEAALEERLETGGEKGTRVVLGAVGRERRRQRRGTATRQQDEEVDVGPQSAERSGQRAAVAVAHDDAVARLGHVVVEDGDKVVEELGERVALGTVRCGREAVTEQVGSDDLIAQIVEVFDLTAPSSGGATNSVHEVQDGMDVEVEVTAANGRNGSDIRRGGRMGY